MREWKYRSTDSFKFSFRYRWVIGSMCLSLQNLARSPRSWFSPTTMLHVVEQKKSLPLSGAEPDDNLLTIRTTLPCLQVAAGVKLLAVLTFQSLPVTWCTNSLAFNNCTVCPHCIYVFCIYLRTNSHLCHLQHKLIGFYNRDVKCLLHGTNWIFI